MDLNIIQLGQNNKVPASSNLPVAGSNANKTARETAEKFEAMFISQLLQSMPSGSDPDGPFGGGQTEKIFQGMMNEQYGKSIAKHGGVGIADSVYREILKMQEVKNGQ